MDKILSGRFLLTVTAAMVFAIMSINGMLPSDKVSEILLIIIYAYFTKKDDAKKGGTQV